MLFDESFIRECLDKYYNRPSVTIKNQSGVNLVYTDNKVYNLDKIMFYRNRSSGIAPLAIAVLDSNYNKAINTYICYEAIDYYVNDIETLDPSTNEPIIDPSTELPFKGLIYQKFNELLQIYEWTYYDDIRKYPGIVTKLRTYIYNNYDNLKAVIPNDINIIDGAIYLNDTENKTNFNPLDLYIEEWIEDFDKTT